MPNVTHFYILFLSFVPPRNNHFILLFLVSGLWFPSFIASYSNSLIFGFTFISVFYAFSRAFSFFASRIELKLISLTFHI